LFVHRTTRRIECGMKKRNSHSRRVSESRVVRGRDSGKPHHSVHVHDMSHTHKCTTVPRPGPSTAHRSTDAPATRPIECAHGACPAGFRRPLAVYMQTGRRERTRAAQHLTYGYRDKAAAGTVASATASSMIWIRGGLSPVAGSRACRLLKHTAGRRRRRPPAPCPAPAASSAVP